MTNDSSNLSPDADHPPVGAAPLGLPRLQVIHLMLWMAATAVALAPYQLQQQAQAQMSPGAQALSSAPATALGMVYGVAAGGFLFIAAALPIWKRQGRVFRLEPGHWVAIQGACQWFVWLATWSALFLSADQPYGVMRLLTIPRLLLGLAFFLIYLRLVVRSGESLPWRWTYLALAVLPAAASCFAMILPFVGGPRNQVIAQLLPHGIAAATIGLLLLIAMLNDLRRQQPRHWTHWLGAGMRLAVLFSAATMHLYYVLYPGALTR
jgi:hypothetical protein